MPRMNSDSGAAGGTEQRYGMPSATCLGYVPERATLAIE
jgi:hypothetical protein